jgi:hypothetical protein
MPPLTAFFFAGFVIVAVRIPRSSKSRTTCS